MSEIKFEKLNAKSKFEVTHTMSEDELLKLFSIVVHKTNDNKQKFMLGRNWENFFFGDSLLAALYMIKDVNSKHVLAVQFSYHNAHANTVSVDTGVCAFIDERDGTMWRHGRGSPAGMANISQLRDKLFDIHQFVIKL